MTSKISSAGAAMSITATGAQVERRHASQAAKPDGRATVSTDGSSSGWPDRGGTRFAMSARVRRDGQFRVIDASQLVRGDLVVLRPRDRISADFTLTRSHAAR
jgi:magnesium-transporting ATPase (P-type)